jgi:hypothetical protein
MTLEQEQALGDPPGVELPRVQAFYSQYEYVVGYYGVDTYVDARCQSGHEQRFGYPLAIHVSDYGETGVELTEEGYPTVERPSGWSRPRTLGSSSGATRGRPPVRPPLFR